MNERMINCPMQAVPKLFEALTEDIAWAVENEVRLFLHLLTYAANDGSFFHYLQSLKVVMVAQVRRAIPCAR